MRMAHGFRRKESSKPHGVLWLQSCVLSSLVSLSEAAEIAAGRLYCLSLPFSCLDPWWLSDCLPSSLQLSLALQAPVPLHVSRPTGALWLSTPCFYILREKMQVEGHDYTVILSDISSLLHLLTLQGGRPRSSLAGLLEPPFHFPACVQTVA